MADLPSADVKIEDAAVAGAPGTNLITVLACVPSNADKVPRMYGNWADMLAFHGYGKGVDYSALHMQETKKPVLFVPLPIATPGTVGRKNTAGNTGSSVVDVTAGGSGALDEFLGRVTVITGGTIGTDEIMLGLSLDDGRNTKRIRLGTASSFVIPNTGLTLTFGAGTLVAGDTVLTFASTAPMWTQADLQTARQNLAAQQRSVRTWLVDGVLLNSTDGNNVVTEVNAYETTHDRFVVARAELRDRLPLANMSKVEHRMTGNPNVTFAEVGATGDTITRSAGSFISDGFAVGDLLVISGSASNNLSTLAKITGVTATVLTLDTDDLTPEGPVGNVTIIGRPSLTFAGGGQTVTRAGGGLGSWLDDGFRVGDSVTISGTASNNVTRTITALTATVMTLNGAALVAEVKSTTAVSVTTGETKAVWMAALNIAFGSIDGQKRVNFAAGRGFKMSPIHGFELRRSSAWGASLREYQHDVHIPSWRKKDLPLLGFSLLDRNEQLVEFDERVDGGALAARFTCFRTYGNGPGGTFVALDLTRNTEGSLLSRHHNMNVANVACAVVHAETENAIGEVLTLNPDGTATADSLNQIKERVNSAVEMALLQDKGEGQRASSAVWTPSVNNILNVPGAELTGVLALLLNGTLEKITTRVRIQTAG